MQHQPPVSNDAPKGPISLFFSSFFFSNKGKEGSLAHKLAEGGGGGEDNGMDQASFKEDSPCREANDRKAKLPKFEQLVLIFKLSSSNDRALYGKPVRGGTNS